MDRSALGDVVHRWKRRVLAYARSADCREIEVVRRLQIKRRALVMLKAYPNGVACSCRRLSHSRSSCLRAAKPNIRMSSMPYMIRRPTRACRLVLGLPRAIGNRAHRSVDLRGELRLFDVAHQDGGAGILLVGVLAGHRCPRFTSAASRPEVRLRISDTEQQMSVRFRA
jgi:hypothetical protein